MFRAVVAMAALGFLAAGCSSEGGLNKELLGIWCAVEQPNVNSRLLPSEWIKFTDEKSPNYDKSRPWHIYYYKLKNEDPASGEYRTKLEFKSKNAYGKDEKHRNAKDILLTLDRPLFSQRVYTPKPGEETSEFQYQHHLSEDSLIIIKSSITHQYTKSKDGINCP